MPPGYSLGQRKLSGGDLGCERVLGSVGRDGLGKQEALAGLAAKLKQRGPLFLGLDTFGNYRHVKAAGEIKNGFDDGGTLGIHGQPLNEGTVDFEGIELQRAQAAKRRVAGAEVVQLET